MDQYFQQPEYGGGGGTAIEKCISNYQDENEEGNKYSSGGGFECNICLDPVHEPVVTLCGHLYCWPCIYKWIHFQTANSEEEKGKMKPQCPVCKTNISERKLIPLYAKGQTSKPSSSNGKTLNNSMGIIIPPRPSSPPSSSSSSCVSPNWQQQQFHHRTLLQPAAALAGRMVYERIFGNLYNGESYRLAGSSSPRMRRHLVETDRSLGRLCFFLFCCLMFCLLLF